MAVCFVLAQRTAKTVMRGSGTNRSRQEVTAHRPLSDQTLNRAPLARRKIVARKQVAEPTRTHTLKGRLRQLHHTSELYPLAGEVSEE